MEIYVHYELKVRTQVGPALLITRSTNKINDGMACVQKRINPSPSPHSSLNKPPAPDPTFSRSLMPMNELISLNSCTC